MAHTPDTDPHSPDDWPWEGLMAFHAAARAGSFSRAAKALGTTQPTIGRRIDAFEEAVGARVLHRDSRGCRPTPLGERLLPHVEQMQGHADVIRQVLRAREDDLSGVVRVACGPLLGRLFARRILSIVEGAPGLQVEILPGIRFVDVAAGEADIALRNRRPRAPSLAGRRVRLSRFAVYGAPIYVDHHPAARSERRWAECRWVGHPAASTAPSARWLRERLGRDPAIRLGSSLAIIEGAAAGAGLCILPGYAGDDEPRLMRLSPPLEGLAFESWLVMPDAIRDTPRIRWVVERILALLGAADG